MGKLLLAFASGFGLALALVGAVALYQRWAPRPVAALASAPSPEPAKSALPSAEPAATPAQSVSPAPAPPPEIARHPPDLPTVVVNQRPVHAVPDEDSPSRPVTLKTPDGRTLALRSPPPSTYVPSTSPLTLSPPPSLAHPSSPQPTPTMIGGAARVADAVSLTVSGRSVKLFGVRMPQVGDRCAMSAQAAPRACGDVAREILTTRLRANPTVSCRVPAGQRSAPPAAICLDASGVDLGGFLIAEGLVLADSSQSYDYVGAEGVAHSYRRGLWRYR